MTAQRSSTMLGQIEGTLIGIRVVKAAGAERFERRRYTTHHGRPARRAAEDGPLRSVGHAGDGNDFAAGRRHGAAGRVVLVLIRKTLDSSSFILIMACLVGIGESLRRVSKVNNVLQRSNTAAARIFETLDVPVERAWPREQFARLEQR